MNVEANPNRMFIVRLNLKGCVGVIRHLFGIGKNPKLTFVSFVEIVEIPSSSSSSGTAIFSSFPSGWSGGDLFSAVFSSFLETISRDWDETPSATGDGTI